MEDYTSLTIYYEDKENDNKVVSKHYDNISIEMIKEIEKMLDNNEPCLLSEYWQNKMKEYNK